MQLFAVLGSKHQKSRETNMRNRTLQALIVHVFLFGGTTVSLAWSGLIFLYGAGPMWAPIANGFIWFVSLCGAVLCYRELRGIGTGGSRSSVDQQATGHSPSSC